MFKNITIEQMKELLSQLGIEVSTNEEGKLIAIDTEHGDVMTINSTSNPLTLVPKDEIKKVASQKDLIKPSTFICLQAPNKFLKYYIREAIQPNGESFTTLMELNYQNRRPDDYIEDTRVRFDRSLSKNGEMSINTLLCFGQPPYDVEKRKTITVYGNGCIHFELDGRDGFYDEGRFQDGWYIEEKEMKEELKSNELIPLFSTFAKDQYPKIIETIEQASTQIENQK